MNSNILRTLSVVGLLSAGCVGPSDDGTSDEDIIGGTTTSGFPAVGIVGVSTDAEMCTGFLVSPTIVVTAAHCIKSGNTAYGFYTGIGHQVTVQDVTQHTLDTLPDLEKHAVLESHAYPQANLAMSPFRNDVAYVRLAQPINVAPLSFGPNPAVHATCTAVGYGMVSTTSPTGLAKKTASVKVGTIDAYDIAVSYGTGVGHKGDSGGPLICNGDVVGVSSWIDNYTTSTSYRRYARTDGAVGAWIDSIVNPPVPGEYASGDPFDYGLVLKQSQMVSTMIAQLHYATATAPRAIAVNADGLGYVSVQPGSTAGDVTRTALEACYVIGGRKPCALLAIDGDFAIDGSALAASFTATLAKPVALTDLPFVPDRVRTGALVQYVGKTGVKAIAVGLDGTATFVPKDTTDVIGSQAEAERLALERCEMSATSSPCTLFARGNTVVLDPLAMAWTPVIDYTRTTVQPNIPGMTVANYNAHMVPYLAGLAQGFQGVTYIAENGQGGNSWRTTAAQANSEALAFCNQYVGTTGKCFRYATNRNVVMTPSNLDAIRNHSLALHCSAMPRLDCATHDRMGCHTSGTYYTTHAGGVALETCSF